MLLKEGKFSAKCFLITFSIVTLMIADLFLLLPNQILDISSNFWWFLPIYFLLLTAFITTNYSGFMFQVGIRSVLLAGIFVFGLFVYFYSSLEWRLFGLYMCVMSFFHYSEFLAIAWCNPRTLSVSSFLLNHSTQYNIAAVTSWIEFVLEFYFLPDIKKFQKISYIGLILCIIGEGLRKCAMITGSTNFAHIVQTERNDNHVLITHGIYSIFRHPSYVGWFYWSIGTQILLLNPLCIVGYAIASWRFFKDRIMHEEHTLLYFFGRDYMDYQKTVGTGLPGIKGFLLEE